MLVMIGEVGAIFRATYGYVSTFQLRDLLALVFLLIFNN